MTSLRTFQTEIDEISHREVAKQRAYAVERAKLEKDAKKTTSKGHARKESTEAADVSKSPAKEPIASPAVPGSGDAVMSDVDEQLQVSALPQYTPHRALRRYTHLSLSTITLTCVPMHRMAVITALPNTRKPRDSSEPHRLPTYAKLWRVCVPNRFAPDTCKIVRCATSHRGGYMAGNDADD